MQDYIKKSIITEILITLALVLTNHFITPIPLAIQLLPIGYPIAMSILFRGFAMTIKTINDIRMRKPPKKDLKNTDIKTPPPYHRERAYKNTPYPTNKKKHVRQRTRD